MEIALVIQHADAGRGGAERYTVQLAHALRERGHAPTVIAQTFGQGAEGLRQVAVGGERLTRAGTYRAFLDDLDEHLASQRYDIVHAMLPVRRCDVYHPHSGLAAAVVAEGHAKNASAVRRAGARVANRVNAKRQAYARVERGLLGSGRPPVVLCLSDRMKETVRRYYPLEEGRLVKLFNAIDLQRFDPAMQGREATRATFGCADGDVVGIFVAQNWELKGLRQAIEAMAAVGDRRLRLLVVGQGDEARYRALASSLGVGDRVRFTGPRSDLPALYGASDYFVLPTRSDVCSLVLLEALAMGRPSISTAQNGACEVMTNGREGFVLASAEDVGGLAEAMRKMLDAEQRRRMSRAALELRAELSYAAHLDRLESLYASLARP